MLWVVAVLLVMHRSSHLVPGFVGGLGSEGMIVTVTIKCKGRCYPSAGAIHLQHIRIANPAKMGSRVEPERFGGANPALGWGILEVVNPNPNRKRGSVGGLGCYKIGTDAPNP